MGKARVNGQMVQEKLHEELKFRGVFRGLRFRFSIESAIEVIIGPNGAGKSTLLEAIAFSLIPLNDINAAVKYLDYLVSDFEEELRGDYVSALVSMTNSEVQLENKDGTKLLVSVEGGETFPITIRYKTRQDEIAFGILNVGSTVNVPMFSIPLDKVEIPTKSTMSLSTLFQIQGILQRAVPTKNVTIRMPITIVNKLSTLKTDLPKAFAYPPGVLRRSFYEEILQELSMVAFTNPSSKEAEGFKLLHERGLKLPSLGTVKVETGPFPADRMPMTYLKVETEKGVRKYLPLYQHGRGIIKLIQLATVLYSKDIVLIDEPENSMHPEAMAWLTSIIVDAAERGTKVILSTQNYEFLRTLVIASLLYNELKDVEGVAKNIIDNVEVTIDESVLEKAPISIHILCPPRGFKRIEEIKYSGEDLIELFERDLRKEFYYFERCF